MNILPKISIIIPVYNVELYIAECLQSVMRQTYDGEMECILVDDCSSDNSIVIAWQLISDYHGKIEFHILHHEHNRGLSASRNTGTEFATGEYVFYLDSDDYISDDCLTLLTKPLNTSNYDMIIGDYVTFGDYLMPSLLFEQKTEINGTPNIFHEFAHCQLPVTAWNKLCNLIFLKKNSLDFVEGQLHEDDLWMYKICISATKVAIQKHVTYFYRQRTNSIVRDSNIKIKQRFDSFFITIDYILNHKGCAKLDDYENCALTYVNKWLMYALAGDFDFYKEYQNMRSRFQYYPISAFLHQKETLRSLFRMIHYQLPVRLGYITLIFRRMISKYK